MRSYRLTSALWLVFALAGCSPSPSAQAPYATGSTSAAAPLVTAGPDGIALDEVAPDPREPILAKSIEAMLSEEHLRQQPVDDAVSKQAFVQYLERLDGGKLFLISEHLRALETFADQMDDEMRAGNLILARKGAALIAARRVVIAGVVDEILKKPADFTVVEDLETDPEKRKYAATEEELRDRWRKVLKLQVLDRVQQMVENEKLLKEPKKKPADEDNPILKSLDPIPPTFEGKEKKAREELAISYSARFTRLADMDPLEPAESFLNSIATIYDPHTQYLAPADKDNFDIAMTGSLQGIGASLGEEDHYIVVRNLVPGGASWKQGDLSEGDLILAVSQQGEKPVDVTDMPIDKVVKMIRGPKGTVVILTVKKPDGRAQEISITRDVIEIEASYARGAILDLGPNDEPVGYVYLPSFYGGSQSGPNGRNATDDVDKFLKIFQQQKLAGAIVDLRGNGGGLLDHARDITGLLIETGPVVQTRTSRGELSVLVDKNPKVSFTGEVIVLTDRFSASASEILAGALQDYERALIVGTGPTHGKGTVQILVDLDQLRASAPGLGRPSGKDPLGVLKLTIQQYFRVDGDSTQSRGVTPDVVLPDPAAYIESGERFLDHAIPWSKVAPVPFKPYKHSWNAGALSTSSAKRQAAEPAFKKVDARGHLLKSRRDDTVVSLELKTWQAKREADEKALEAVELKLDEGAKRFDVKVVGDAPKPQPRPENGKRPKRDLTQWQDDLARDPWVEEALHIIKEMEAPS